MTFKDCQRGGAGRCVPNDLNCEVLCFGLSDMTLFLVSLALLGISFGSVLKLCRLRDRMCAYMSVCACVCVCFRTLNY